MHIRCKIVGGVYIALSIFSLALIPMSQAGLWGMAKDPLSGLFAVILAMPWILWTKPLVSETSTLSNFLLIGVCMLINTAILVGLCGWFHRRKASKNEGTSTHLFLCGVIGFILAFGSLQYPVGATADGPDFFAVTGVAPHNVLNIRNGPSVGAKKIGAIPHNGRRIQNRGCQGGMSFAAWEKASPAERARNAKQRWCKIHY